MKRRPKRILKKKERNNGERAYQVEIEGGSREWVTEDDLPIRMVQKYENFLKEKRDVARSRREEKEKKREERAKTRGQRVTRDVVLAFMSDAFYRVNP